MESTVERSTTKHAVQDVTVDDFVTGLLAGLAARHIVSVSLRGEPFYKAVESAFMVLTSEAVSRSLDLRFHVFLDPVYGDSSVVRDAISGAVQRDLVSLDNPEYQDMRLKLGTQEAEILLDRLPGGSGLFEKVAAKFLEEYRWVIEGPH